MIKQPKLQTSKTCSHTAHLWREVEPHALQCYLQLAQADAACRTERAAGTHFFELMQKESGENREKSDTSRQDTTSQRTCACAVVEGERAEMNEALEVDAADLACHT